MSKKDKSKFRKQIKAQLMQDVAQAQSEIKAPQKAKIVTRENIAVANNIVNKNQTSPLNPPVIAINSEFNLPQIRYDLKKTALVVLGLAIVIVALYYVDLRYNILLNFGDWLFKVLNIK